MSAQVASGGHLEKLTVDPRLLRSGSEEVCAQIMVAVNAAMEDLKTRTAEAGPAATDPAAPAEPPGGLQAESIRQMSRFAEGIAETVAKINGAASGVRTMAGDEIDIKSGSLRKAGSDLRRASQALDTAWKGFQLDAKNLKYGSADMVGSLIGAAYEAVLEWAHTSYDSAAKAFASYGEAVHHMADQYDSAAGDRRRAAVRASRVLERVRRRAGADQRRCRARRPRGVDGQQRPGDRGACDGGGDLRGVVAGGPVFNEIQQMIINEAINAILYGLRFTRQRIIMRFGETPRPFTTPTQSLTTNFICGS